MGIISGTHKPGETTSMDFNQIKIGLADPNRHFAAIAALMNTQETEPNTAETLSEWYNNQLKNGIRCGVAVSAEDEVLGFNCIYRSTLNRDRCYGTYLIVTQELWGHGLGSLLYDHLSTQAAGLGARTLRARVRDNCTKGLRFASQRGFEVKKHSIEMMLNLRTWDDRCYDAILHDLQAQGFHFTNMAELGDTQDARRNLYSLNNSAAATDPGSDAVPPWATFEEFEKDVCKSYWYHPEAQIIAIDTHTSVWAAMSAITVFIGADHAYNLFTGTDVGYRNRKLAQAVKVLALRKARTFGVGLVRTSHNSENTAMIAIDTKLGYIRTPGMLTMEKELVHG
jgi:RimJ/RimL family protein N-acetyltransferase